MSYSELGDLIAYEEGDMDFQEEVAMFQNMINSGQAWKMQGSYGRAAMSMIEAGYCTLGEEGCYDYWGNYVPSKYEVQPGTKGSVEYMENMIGGDYEF